MNADFRSCQTIVVNADFDVGSNGIQNAMINKFLFGGHIDTKMKDAALNKMAFANELKVIKTDDNFYVLKGLKEGVIIIGNESKGISDQIMQLCTEKITIPKTGEAESLNAAVATGIILSHL